ILIALAFVSVTLQVGSIIFRELLSGRAVVERSVVAYGPVPEDAFEEALLPQALPASHPEQSAPEPLRGSRSSPIQRDVELEALAASILGGSMRRVTIASLDGWNESMRFAEKLTARLIENGLSVAEIDAASHQQGIELGLTDLCSEEADFGDIVH